MNLYKQKSRTKSNKVQVDLFIQRKRSELLFGYLETCGIKPDFEVFRQMVYLLKSETKRKTVTAVGGHKIKKRMLKSLLANDYSYANYLYHAWMDEQFSDEARNLVSSDIRQKIEQQFNYEKKGPKSQLCKRLNKLQKMFELTDDEVICLVILYLGENDDFVDVLFYTGYSYEASGRIRKVAELSGLSQAKVTRIVAETGALRRYGLMNSDIEIEYHISEFLCGISKNTLRSRYYAEYNGHAIDLSMHDTITQHRETIVNLVKNRDRKSGVNLLFYGSPGVGKTEFARALGKSLGFRIYEVKNFVKDNDDDSPVMKRFMALKTCRESIDNQKSIIILDEADEMLNGSAGLSFWGDSRNTEKNLVNEALDERLGTVIWITNTYSYIDESTRRRFDYSVEFPKLGRKQRINIWKNTVQKYKLNSYFSDDEINSIAGEYQVSAGGIDVAVRNFRTLYSEEKQNESAVDVLRTVLNAHQKIMTDQDWQDSQATIVKDYSLAGLNIKGELPVEKVIAIFKAFSEKEHDVRNMNMLLYGPPGTGKTEFVKFVAKSLGKQLLIKKNSDLLGMYVGETEKNIRNAFEEAEHDDAILFFDEVEGLLAERSHSYRSWEVTQVNELLSQMELFKGIFICASNFKKNVDNAAIRRFNLKLEFDYLNDDGKRLFFNTVLSELTDARLTECELAQLAKIDNLTPGDFKVVKQKYLFLQEQGLVNMTLIDALFSEVKHKQNIKSAKLGF